MKTPVSSELLDKYLSGTCTPQEREEVENWYQSFENSPEINTLFPETENEDYSKSVFEKIKSKIKLKEIEDKNIWKLPINRQAYWYLAASVLISIGVSNYLTNPIHFQFNYQLMKKKPLTTILGCYQQITCHSLLQTSVCIGYNITFS